MEYLIPDHPFEVMPQFMLLVVAAVAIWTLIRGADTLVASAASIAQRLGIPKIIVGATIVSLGTTSPECAVSVMAAWSGNAGLALGNAVGSIIADTGLIFGLSCLLVVLPADRFVLRRQGRVKMVCDALLAALCYGIWLYQGDSATLGRSVGVFLCVLLVVYLFGSMRWARQHTTATRLEKTETSPKSSPPEAPPEAPPAPPEAPPAPPEALRASHTSESADSDSGMPPSIWLLLAGLLAGLVMVIFASRFLVASATQLATRWGVPQVVIAATLVAMGTSLPELMVAISAIRKRHLGLLVGNIIGADILNVLFVVGASALARPLPIVDPAAAVPRIFLYLHLPTLLVMLLLFLGYLTFAVRRGHFRRWQGYPLVLLYVAYVALQFLLTT